MVELNESLSLQFVNALGDGIGQHFFVGSTSASEHQGSSRRCSGFPIAHTKLRMIFAVAQVMSGLSPVDVGAPPVPIVASEVRTGKSSRSECGLCLRV